MRVVENLPPPQPPRSFDLMDVTEEELRFLHAALGPTKGDVGWYLYRTIALALGEDEG